MKEKKNKKKLTIHTITRVDIPQNMGPLSLTVRGNK
jgi:hypothetical protein